MHRCESWTIKKTECQRTDAFEPWYWRRLLSKGNQSWIFIRRTDVEVETPILWPPDVKNWFIGKDPDAEKDWRWKGKGTTEDEMVGWHHQLDGHELEQVLGVSDGQGSLACCSPWGSKELGMAEQLNWLHWKCLSEISNDLHVAKANDCILIFIFLDLKYNIWIWATVFLWEIRYFSGSCADLSPWISSILYLLSLQSDVICTFVFKII